MIYYSAAFLYIPKAEGSQGLRIYGLSARSYEL